MQQEFPGRKKFTLERILESSKQIASEQSNLHYTRGITSKRVTSGGVHLRGSAPGQHCFEEALQWWRAVGDTASVLTGPVIESQASRFHSDVVSD